MKSKFINIDYLSCMSSSIIHNNLNIVINCGLSNIHDQIENSQYTKSSLIAVSLLIKTHSLTEFEISQNILSIFSNKSRTLKLQLFLSISNILILAYKCFCQYLYFRIIFNKCIHWQDFIYRINQISLEILYLLDFNTFQFFEAFLIWEMIQAMKLALIM